MFIECFTPNDENGVCINILRCPVLRRMLETQRQNSTVVTFLRNSACGYEGRNPKVCCPLDNEPTRPTNNHQTLETTTSRLGGSNSNRPNNRPNTGSSNNNNNNNYNENVSSIKLPSQSTCGKTNTSHIRIVGGNPADLGKDLNMRDRSSYFKSFFL